MKNADGVRNLEKILKSHQAQERLVVVISAIGKTTNLLEQVLDAYYYDKSKLPELTATLRENHYTIVRELAVGDDSSILNRLNEILACWTRCWQARIRVILTTITTVLSASERFCLPR